MPSVVESRVPLRSVLALACLVACPHGARGQEHAPDEEPLDIVVTGRRSPERLGASAVAVEVVDRAQIVASGMRDAAQILANQPGIQIDSSFRGDAIQMQGLDSQHTLILVDGERLIGARDGALDLTRLFAGDIERIEIVRGPASAIYGSDAIAGVVNIITRAPRQKPGGEAQGRYGLSRDGGHQGDVWGSAFGGSETFRARGNVAYRRNAAFDLSPGTAATTGNRLDSVSANLRTSYTPSPRFQLPVFLRAVRREQKGVDDGAGGAIYDRVARGDELMVTTVPSWKLRQADQLTLALNYAYLRSQFLRDQRRDDDGDTYEDANEQLATVRLQSDSELGPVHLSSGLEALGQRYETPRLSELGTRGRISPYAQLEYRPLAQLALVPSARLDVDSQYGVNVSPRIALRYDPASWLVLRGAVGRGFRAPSFSELYLIFANPAAGYRVTGNTDLEPERSLGANLSAEVHGVPWVSGMLNLFRNELRDLIDTRLSGIEGGEQIFAYSNYARARTQGVESSLQSRPLEGLLLELNYTFTDARDLVEDTELQGRARHRGSLRSVYTRERYALSARCLFVGKRHVMLDGRDLSTPYAVLDLRASFVINRHVEPYLVVENATDAGDANNPLRPATFYAGLNLSL
jgi:outer membrane receptor for ferrienterochelin and colicins